MKNKFEIAKQVVKTYEKLSGYRVCNLCNKAIKRGMRVMLVREYKRSYNDFYGTKVIGAICLKCYKKLKGNYK